MKATHYLLATYLVIIAFFAVFFSIVINSEGLSGDDIFRMVGTIVMLALIPFGIILLAKRRR